MPSYAKQGLVIRALRVENCPVFHPGDVVTVCGREILCAHFNTYCSYQLSTLRPMLKCMEKELDFQHLDLDIENGVFRCRDYDCSGEFELNVAPASDVGVIRGAIGLMHPPAAGTAPTLPSTGTPVSMQEDTAETTDAPEPGSRAVPSMPDARSAPPPRTPTEPQVATIVDAGDAPGATNADEAKPFLRRMRPDLALALVSAGRSNRYPADIHILSQGEENDSLYIIRRGRVSIECRMDDGSRLELASLGPGEVFGEMSLLSGEECNATARTTENTELVCVQQEDLDVVMASNPALHRWFSHLFVERLHNTDQQLAERLAGGMSGRLSMIGLLDVVQTLLIAKQSGRLHISHRMHSGVLYIGGGQILDATLERQKGEDAFFTMARWTEGSFRFLKEDNHAVPRTVNRDTMYLMMDAARMIDEEPTP